MRCMNGCYCISELNTCQRNAVRTELMNPRSELDQECFGFFPGWRQVQWVGPCFYFSFILWSSPCADYKRKENRIQHGQAAHCEVTSPIVLRCGLLWVNALMCVAVCRCFSVLIRLVTVSCCLQSMHALILRSERKTEVSHLLLIFYGCWMHNAADCYAS
jgi:hypothetical protein